jgi:hypothetical protein
MRAGNRRLVSFARKGALRLTILMVMGRNRRPSGAWFFSCLNAKRERLMPV